jgi:hypothetical protein
MPVVHADIKRRNIMAPPKPKGHGLRLTGVLGETALFTTRENKTVGIEQGKSANGVTVVAVDGYTVTIKYKDKTETVKLFPRAGGARGPSPRSSGGMMRRHRMRGGR